MVRTLMADGNAFEQLIVAYRLWTAGEAEQALTALDGAHAAVEGDGRYLGEWWRLRGLALQSRGKLAEAEGAFRTGLERPAAGHQRGRLTLSLAGLLEYTQRRDEALANYHTALFHFRRSRDDESAVVTSYNVAWLQLQFGRFLEAGATLDEVILTAERGEGRLARALVPVGRSMVAVSLGQLDLALQRAVWGVQLAKQPVYEVRARQYLASVLWVRGEREEARRCLAALQGVGLATSDPATVASLQVLQGLLDDDETRLERFEPEAHVAWRARGLFWRARQAWQAADNAQALSLARDAVALVQRQEEAVVQLTSPDFHAWLLARGVSVVTAGGQPQGPTRVTLVVRGPLRLALHGQPVRARLSPEAAALGAVLALEGPQSERQLCRRALGGASRTTIERAAARVGLLVGDPDAVVGTGDGEQRTWRLSERYRWSVDDRGTGTLLAGLDSELTRAWPESRFAADPATHS